MRYLITGAGGQLGRELVVVLAREPGAEVVTADHAALAVEDASAVEDLVAAVRPDVVIHAAALTDVDRCEREPELARAVNEEGTANVARAAEAVGAHLLYVSTDYVFDGHSERPYREDDQTNPLSVYGTTKRNGELACAAEASVVRTSWVAGAYGANFVRTILEVAARPGDLSVVADQRASPTFTEDLAPALLALARDRRPGVVHVTNAGAASRYELARETLAAAGLDPGRVVPISTHDLQPPRAAVRPAYSVLDNGAFTGAGYRALPPWQDGLARLVARLLAAPR